MADISKIQLPSGSVYNIKDATAREAIAGGVSFIIAWNGTSTPVVDNIPAGVKVTYNDVEYTGTLSAETTGSGTHAQAGAFYLVKSSTQTTSGALDVYDEYVPVGTTGSKTWEKLGDTQIDLSDVVTSVSTTNDTVIGSDATFKITQPTIALATDSTSGDGKVQIVTGITSATASGDSVTALTGLGTPTTSTVLTGAKPKENSTTTTNAIEYVKTQGTASTTKLSASVSLGTPTTSNVASSVSPTTKKLAVSTIYGVKSGNNSTTTASKAAAATSQTTVSGFTAHSGTSGETAYDSTNDILKGAHMGSGDDAETLIFGAYAPATQTTTQFTFSDVTVPIRADSSTTFATGSTTTSGDGADVVTDVAVGDTVAAVTGYSSPSATIASGSTGDVTVATGIGAATTRYLTIDSDGTASAVTGYASPTTDTVLGTSSTITVTPSQTYIKGTASGAKTEWQSKDEVSAITSVTANKGNA